MMRAVEAHSCRRRSPTDRCGPPLFRALDALTVDDRGGRAGLSLGQLPTPDVKRVMDAIQRAVVGPAAEVVVHRAAGRQVLRQRCPLATGAQDIPGSFGSRLFEDGERLVAMFGE